MCGSENGAVTDHRSSTLESVRLTIGFCEKCDHPWEFGEISLIRFGGEGLRYKDRQLLPFDSLGRQS